MIKRTLYFGNPAHLYLRNGQLCISAGKKNETDDESKVITVPVEDIGLVIIDHGQITITHGLLAALQENNSAFVTCDNTHHPVGMMLPLDVHHTQSEKFRAQIDAGEPLKKQLWQQTVSAKLRNQAKLLLTGYLKDADNAPRQEAAKWLQSFSREVKSGDTDNHEARGAAIYWQHLFPPGFKFKRSREGEPPNNLLITAMLY